MDPFSAAQMGIGAVSGISSLFGMLGDAAAKRRAEMARQQAITDMGAQLDTQSQNMMQNNARNLSSATGQGGDAVASLGRRLAASMAGAGVYNSSATAGAMAQAQANEGAQLAGLGAQNQYNEQSLLGHNRQYLTGLKMNLANQRYDEASQNYQQSAGGLQSFLGTLGQYHLGQSGAAATQDSLSRSAGGYGNQGNYASGLPNLNIPDPNAGYNFNPKPFQGQGFAPGSQF